MIGAADAAGRGLAREATHAVVALALGQFALQEVYLEVLPDNLRAIKVYETCGFRVTGNTEKADEDEQASRGDMISRIKQKHADPTFILGILGDYGRVESALARSIENLERIVRRSDCRIVAAWEHRRWEAVPLVQTLGMRFPQDRLTAFCGDCPDQPATLVLGSGAAGGRRDRPVPLAGLPAAVGRGRRGLPRFGSRGTRLAGLCRSRRPAMPELCTPDAEERFYGHYLACGRPLRTLPGGGPAERVSWRSTASAGRRSCSASSMPTTGSARVRCGQKAAIRAGRLAESRWTWEDFPLHKGPPRAALPFAQLPRAHGRSDGRRR